MKRTAIVFSSLILAAVLAAFGFYSSSSDDFTGVPDGNQKSIVAEFDATPLWTAGANMTADATFGGGATYTRNDTIWLHALSNSPASTQNLRYNASTNTWATMAPMLLVRDRFSCAVLGNNLYVIGGADAGSVYQTSVQVYDELANTWSNGPVLPVALGWTKSVAYQDSLIYVAGGYTGTTVVSTVYLFNRIAGTWRTATSMPDARFGGGFAISGDTLVYTCGIDAAGATIVNTTFKGVISSSNRGTITWTTGTPAPFTVFRTDAASWGCKGIILYHGSPTTAFTGANNCASYSPGANAWTTLPNIPTATLYANTGSARLSGNIWKLLIAGGYNNAYLRNTQILTDTLCPAPIGGPCDLPELIYYKFENNVGSTTPNYASSPVGTNPAPVVGHTFSNQGMYDSCLLGVGGAVTNMVNTGWATNLGTGDFTISFWVKNLPNQGSLGTNPMYIFGDPTANAFRCFWAGAGVTATDTAILVRATGGTDLRIVLPNPYNTSYVVTIVRSGNTMTGYRNGVQVATATWTAVNLTGTGFQVAGYNPTATPSPLSVGTRMDEFRLYNRALSPADITASWNKSELPGCLTGTNISNNEIPKVFSLSQNYPNPFNPTTNIKFSIPQNGLVKLVVFDILGREVATLVNEVKPAGNYVADFDASTLASGVYFYSLTSGDFTQTKKMLLVK